MVWFLSGESKGELHRVAVVFGQGREDGVEFTVNERAGAGATGGPSAIFKRTVIKDTVLKVREFKITLLEIAVSKCNFLKCARQKHAGGEHH
jgi:hypothetical protein